MRRSRAPRGGEQAGRGARCRAGALRPLRGRRAGRGPGTLDGGDVLQIGDHFYVGLTERTNEEGARQFSEIVRRHGFDVSLVPLRRFLHLKTGVSYLGNGDLIVAGELAENDAFASFDRLHVPPREKYCANCIRVNDSVIFPAGYEGTKARISARGYDEVIELEMSEFRKVDGGLSCLSLRLP
jgi:dimethylargininase